MSFEEGIARFNSGKFWDAHESWEELWLKAKDEDRTFLQGLIQLAAAYHHIVRGTTAGAGRLLRSALTKLEEFPDGYRGVDRAEAVGTAARHLEQVIQEGAIGRIEPPKLRYNRDLS